MTRQLTLNEFCNIQSLPTITRRICKSCGKALTRRNNEKECLFLRRKHCNQKCVYTARTGTRKKVISSTKYCLNPSCGKRLLLRNNELPYAFLQRKYCNIKCKGGRWGDGSHLINKSCDNCAKPIKVKLYTLNRMEHHFCNRQCMGEFYRGKDHGGKPINTYFRCSNCNNIFQRDINLARNCKGKHVYCSKACQYSHFSRLSRGLERPDGWNHWNSKPDFLTTCELCKIEFTQPGKYTSTPRKFCNNCLLNRKWEIYKMTSNKAASTNHNNGNYRKISDRMINGGALKASVASYRVQLRGTTTIEQRIMMTLVLRGIPFIHQFQYNYGVADFFVFPNIIIECDGTYWHSIQNVKERDLRKTMYLWEQEGFQVYRLSERAINEDVNRCVDLIQQYGSYEPYIVVVK